MYLCRPVSQFVFFVILYKKDVKGTKCLRLTWDRVVSGRRRVLSAPPPINPLVHPGAVTSIGMGHWREEGGVGSNLWLVSPALKLRYQRRTAVLRAPVGLTPTLSEWVLLYMSRTHRLAAAEIFVLSDYERPRRNGYYSIWWPNTDKQDLFVDAGGTGFNRFWGGGDRCIKLTQRGQQLSIWTKKVTLLHRPRSRDKTSPSE